MIGAVDLLLREAERAGDHNELLALRLLDAANALEQEATTYLNKKAAAILAGTATAGDEYRGRARHTCRS